AGVTKVREAHEAALLVGRFTEAHGLWPDGAREQVCLDGLRFIRSHAVARSGETTDVVTNNAVLIYRRITDGVSWVGPGSRIAALIEGQDVVGFERHWRQMASNPTRTALLTPVEQVMSRMLDELALVGGERAVERGHLELERAELGYYAAGR